MKIQGKELNAEKNYLDPVTYVPGHANHDCSHPDCEQGVIIGLGYDHVRVLYTKGRTVQATNPDDLVWG